MTNESHDTISNLALTFLTYLTLSSYTNLLFPNLTITVPKQFRRALALMKPNLS
jgi:hypothetical protein